MCKFSFGPYSAGCAGYRLYAVAGKRRYDRKQSGFGGQTKPVFRKKVCSNLAASSNSLDGADTLLAAFGRKCIFTRASYDLERAHFLVVRVCGQCMWDLTDEDRKM
jgi:hypothetical protein